MTNDANDHFPIVLSRAQLTLLDELLSKAAVGRKNAKDLCVIDEQVQQGLKHLGADNGT